MYRYPLIRMVPFIVIVAVLCLNFVGIGAVAASHFQQCGKASWYKLTGKTASGERADPKGMTAAHRTLPFGTLVTVTNLANRRTVTVRINDRGPFSKGRIIDVTLAAAKQLGFVKQGVARVKVSGKSDNFIGNSSRNCP